MTTVQAMATRKARNPAGNPIDEDDIAFSEGISRRVATLCEMRGFTYRDVEREAGLSNGSVAQLVSGKRAGSTTLKLIWRVARALGTSVDFLCDGTAGHRARAPSGDAESQTAFQFEQALGQPKRSRPRLKSRTKKPLR